MGKDKNSKLTSEEIDRKVLALDNLMRQPGWREFTEMVLYLQGIESARLFDKRFVALDPEDKDREHRAIVAVIEVLDKILNLPQWLLKRKPERWNQVLNQLTKEATNG